MTGRDFDTDPSTPGALRGATGADAAATADTDPHTGLAAGLKPPNTDPGLGPAGPPVPAPVPGAKPAGRQDSVELLLDGMSAPQPERPKTTPRTEGEAAASYHAEHPVHPARTEPDEQEPKVIVERPPLVPTVKVDRAKLQAVIEEADARRRAEEAAEQAKAPVPVAMGPRVLIATVAGLVVVLLIFVLARRKGNDATDDQTGVTGVTPVATETATATATATAAATVTAIPMPPATVPPAATAPSQPTPTAHMPVSALPAAPSTPKPRPRPTSTSGDVGEFKTTFH